MPYQPPHKHTESDLREALIADLEVDLRFSRVNDPDTPEWVAYRNRIEEELKRLRAGKPDESCDPTPQPRS